MQVSVSNPKLTVRLVRDRCNHNREVTVDTVGNVLKFRQDDRKFIRVSVNNPKLTVRLVRNTWILNSKVLVDKVHSVLKVRQDDKKIMRDSVRNSKFTVNLVRSGCSFNSKDSLHRITKKHDKRTYSSKKKMIDPKYRNRRVNLYNGMLESEKKN